VTRRLLAPCGCPDGRTAIVVVSRLKDQVWRTRNSAGHGTRLLQRARDRRSHSLHGYVRRGVDLSLRRVKSRVPRKSDPQEQQGVRSRLGSNLRGKSRLDPTHRSLQRNCSHGFAPRVQRDYFREVPSGLQNADYGRLDSLVPSGHVLGHDNSPRNSDRPFSLLKAYLKVFEIWPGMRPPIPRVTLCYPQGSPFQK
jgi:hypothetical protein